MLRPLIWESLFWDRVLLSLFGELGLLLWVRICFLVLGGRL